MKLFGLLEDRRPAGDVRRTGLRAARVAQQGWPDVRPDVDLNVKDIEWHKKFWVEQFEGVLIQKNGITAVKFPGMLLILNQAPSAGPSLGDSLDHFGFKVKNTAETSAKLKAAGLDV